MASPAHSTYSVGTGLAIHGGRWPGGRLTGNVDLAAVLGAGAFDTAPSDLNGAVELGAVIASGVLASAYAWATELPTDTWTAIPGTAFLSWANANMPEPASAYNGSDPFGAIVNAFCDPAYDQGNGKLYLFGGGHGDGTCNAVIQLDLNTMGYSLVGQPTPVAKYPPAYYNGHANQPGPLTYPSGLQADMFLPLSELPDPADAAYATPLARKASHMYAAATWGPDGIRYFYQDPMVRFDPAAGTWHRMGVAASQIYAINNNFGSQPFQQGTQAIYDEVQGRFVVTFVPGDSGGGWRSGFAIVQPNGTISSIVDYAYNGQEPLISSSNVCRVGRKLYVFSKYIPGSFTASHIMAQGCILDLDTLAQQRFVIQGDQAPSTFQGSSLNQETIPSWYDGQSIQRWNYQPSTRGQIQTVGLTPVSGSGTAGSPFVLPQSVRAVGGTFAGPSGSEVMFVYSRCVWVPGANCAVVLPRSDQPAMALKLS